MGVEDSARVSESDILNPETQPPAEILEVPVRQKSPPGPPVPSVESRDLYSRPCQLGEVRRSQREASRHSRVSRPLTFSSASNEDSPSPSRHQRRSRSRSCLPLLRGHPISRSPSYSSRLSRMDRDCDRESQLREDTQRDPYRGRCYSSDPLHFYFTESIRD